MTGTNMCAMSIKCVGKEADYGLMCADCRAEDAAIERRFSDDVQPDQREPKEIEQ